MTAPAGCAPRWMSRLTTCSLVVVSPEKFGRACLQAPDYNSYARRLMTASWTGGFLVGRNCLSALVEALILWSCWFGGSSGGSEITGSSMEPCNSQLHSQVGLGKKLASRSMPVFPPALGALMQLEKEHLALGVFFFFVVPCVAKVRRGNDFVALCRFGVCIKFSFLLMEYTFSKKVLLK
jgi:hypothetical protein